MKIEKIIDIVKPIGPKHLNTFPPRHMRILHGIAKLLPVNPMMVEIGTKYGRSCTVLSLSRPDATILTVDVKNWEPGNVLGHNVIKLNIPSIRAAKIIDIAIDFLWIDGSHKYEDVVADIVMWTPKIKSGGYVAFHDYNNQDCGVKPAFDRLIDTEEYCIQSREKQHGTRIAVAKKI